MSNRQANSEFSAGNGLFALYLLLFLAGVFGVWLSFHPKSPLRAYDDYYLLFPETGTLGKGSVVQVLGLPRGYVESIALRDDGVVAHAKVEHNLKIPRDSRFRVINVGLLGEREIEIKIGNSSEIFESGDSARGGYDLGSTRLMFMANVMLKTADSLLGTAIQVWDSTLGNPQVLSRLGKTKRGVSHSMNRVGQVVKDMKDSLQLLQGQFKELQGRFESAKKELSPGISATLADVEQIKQQMAGLESQLKVLSADATWLAGQLQSQDVSSGLILQSEEFHGRLKSAMEHVQSLMGDIQKKGLDLNVDIF